MKINYLYFIVCVFCVISCKQRYTPKPGGYLRIDLQPKEYQLYQPENCPFYFYTSNYFALTNKTNCWIDLKYPEHHATIHITYKKINNNIFQLVEDSRNMVYKHTIKADAINEKTYLNKEHNTYGTLYDIQGETASSVQFHITDSVSNFIRGALYFHVNPNQDSLKPIINYLRGDIIQIMESLQWDELNASLE